MKNEFHQGQKLKSISWNNEESVLISGQNKCKEIYVVMEYGQMAGVPWAEATFEDGRIFKYNLAMCECVEV